MLCLVLFLLCSTNLSLASTNFKGYGARWILARIGTRVMASDTDILEDGSACKVPDWAQLGSKPVHQKGHKGTSLGAHEPSPHLFTMH